MFVTRFPDVQEALSRPDIFNVTYAPMMDPSVGPYMLGRDCTEINQRDKGIMRAFMRMEDLPAIRQKVRSLANESVKKQLYTQNQIEVVTTLSRLVPIQLTGEYFGFPGPDLASMFRWGRATQYDMFHNLDNDPKVHQDNIDAGQEMRAYLNKLLPERRAQLAARRAARRCLQPFAQKQFRARDRLRRRAHRHQHDGDAGRRHRDHQRRHRPAARPAVQTPEDPARGHRGRQQRRRSADVSLLLGSAALQPDQSVRRAALPDDYRIARGTLRAKTIKAGATVLVSGRSAMRDGRQLPAASSFAIDRPESIYMHLGYGMHTCLGDQISRIQVPEIVRRILRIPGVRPVAPPDYGVGPDGVEPGPFPEHYMLTFDAPA